MLFWLGRFCVKVVMGVWELCCMEGDFSVLSSVVRHRRFGGESV